jgi:hypothetical protein
LNLGATRITDACLSDLTILSTLEYLNVSATSISNSGLLQLASLKRLRGLAVPRSISAAAITELKRSLPDAWVAAED